VKTSRDEKFQLGAAKATRRIGRRKFLGKSGTVAAAVASIVMGVNARPAFAHGTCAPPYGRYCSGCGASSSCPSGKATCTPGYDRGCNVCPYSTGWWYTGTAPNRHRCRDCISNIIGPIACNGTYVCGCKSTTHY
jgi:hypothetical protein